MRIGSGAEGARRRHHAMITVIWTAMAATTLVYGLILEVAVQASLSFDAGALLGSSLALILVASCFIPFAAAWATPRLFKGGPIKLDEAATESKRIQIVLGRLAVAKVVQFAMLQAGALMGFCAATITRSFFPYLITGSAALVGFALTRPTLAQADTAIHNA